MGSSELCVDQESFTWGGSELSKLHGKCWALSGQGELYLRRERAIWAPWEVLSAEWTRRALPEEGASYLSSMGSVERWVDQESFTWGGSELSELHGKCWALSGPGELYLRRERAIWAPWEGLSAEWTRIYLSRERAIWSPWEVLIAERTRIYLSRERAIWSPWEVLSAERTRIYLRREGAIWASGKCWALRRPGFTWGGSELSELHGKCWALSGPGFTLVGSELSDLHGKCWALSGPGFTWGGSKLSELQGSVERWGDQDLPE